MSRYNPEMIREFYLKNRNDRSLFPIVIKLDDEIPVDYVTLAKRSPFLLGLVQDMGYNSLNMSNINPGIDRITLKKIILSWYECEPFPNESFELLHCVDWLGDQDSKNYCVKTLTDKLSKIYDKFELMSALEKACIYNCDEMVDKLIDKFYEWSDEIIILLKRYHYWKRCQVRYIACYNSDKPIEECLKRLTEPVKEAEQSELRDVLVALFFRNENYQSEKLIKRIIMVYQILYNEITIDSMHPDILELLQDGLQTKLASYKKNY